jgi:hypothetical protein
LQIIHGNVSAFEADMHRSMTLLAVAQDIYPAIHLTESDFAAITQARSYP